MPIFLAQYCGTPMWWKPLLSFICGTEFSHKSIQLRATCFHPLLLLSTAPPHTLTLTTLCSNSHTHPHHSVRTLTHTPWPHCVRTLTHSPWPHLCSNSHTLALTTLCSNSHTHSDQAVFKLIHTHTLTIVSQLTHTLTTVFQHSTAHTHTSWPHCSNCHTYIQPHLFTLCRTAWSAPIRSKMPVTSSTSITSSPLPTSYTQPHLFTWCWMAWSSTIRGKIPVVPSSTTHPPHTHTHTQDTHYTCLCCAEWPGPLPSEARYLWRPPPPSSLPLPPPPSWRSWRRRQWTPGCRGCRWSPPPGWWAGGPPGCPGWCPPGLCWHPQHPSSADLPGIRRGKKKKIHTKFQITINDQCTHWRHAPFSTEQFY